MALASLVATLSVYFYTYYWELSADQISLAAVVRGLHIGGRRPDCGALDDPALGQEAWRHRCLP